MSTTLLTNSGRTHPIGLVCSQHNEDKTAYDDQLQVVIPSHHICDVYLVKMQRRFSYDSILLSSSDRVSCPIEHSQSEHAQIFA